MRRLLSSGQAAAGGAAGSALGSSEPADRQRSSVSIQPRRHGAPRPAGKAPHNKGDTLQDVEGCHRGQELLCSYLLPVVVWRAIGVRTQGSLSKWLSLQGFSSKPRGQAEGGLLASADASEASKKAELQRGLLDLGIAWGLVAVRPAHSCSVWLVVLTSIAC